MSTKKKTVVCGSIHKIHISEATEGNVKIHATWTVRNFMKLYKNNDIGQINSSISPISIETSPAGWKFYFALVPHRENKNLDIYCYSHTLVFLKSIQIKTLTFDKKDWVFHKREQCIFTKECSILQANKWLQLKQLTIKDSYLEDDNKIICLHRNGCLRFRFVFVVTTANDKDGQFKIPPTEIVNDWENLFNEGIYSDVIMKSDDGEEFKVHKAVLASRCSVLKANFDHNTTESITNIVESPLESTVLREMLLFIYTDKTPKLNDIPEKLLAAADYYQLGRLKSLCEEALYKTLTIDNAIETLQLADLHSADKLKQLTLQFIKHDYEQLKQITKTRGWSKLQSVDLLKKIYE